MVRLEHVNKYFNRRKKNEIHVINDTTLQMENKGLVALLGKSADARENHAVKCDRRTG